MFSEKVVPAIKKFASQPFVGFLVALYVVMTVADIVVSLFVDFNLLSLLISLIVNGIMIYAVLVTYVSAANETTDSINTSGLEIMKKLMILNVILSGITVALNLFYVISSAWFLILALFGVLDVILYAKLVGTLDSIIYTIDCAYPDERVSDFVIIVMFVVGILNVVSVLIDFSVFGFVVSVLSCLLNCGCAYMLLQYRKLIGQLKTEIDLENKQKEIAE